MIVSTKLIKLGGSKAVIIPNIWLDSQEKILGYELEQVDMELNGAIVIKPHEEEKE